MKITKLVHSCLLVEMPEPVSRTALFDPGVMSEAAINIDSLVYLDDIFITHTHPDHMSIPLIKKLVTKFPEVRITGTREATAKLKQAGIEANRHELDGVEFFDSPHEAVIPLADPPEQLGIHYLHMLSHPGDSHHFQETMPILALPVTAPWGSAVAAIKLGLKLKPQVILPIHDWFWRDEAREMMYENFERIFGTEGIRFMKLKTGEPVVLDVQPAEQQLTT